MFVPADRDGARRARYPEDRSGLIVEVVSERVVSGCGEDNRSLVGEDEPWRWGTCTGRSP